MAVAALGLSLCACTALSVQPMDDAVNAKHICIKRNAAVIRSDFLPTLEKGFQNHGITTEVFNDIQPDNCEFIATYTATQAWDMAMVLKDAEVWIHQDGTQIAYANYHLRGGGGFSLMKWQGADAKILPLLDQLLAEYPLCQDSCESDQDN